MSKNQNLILTPDKYAGIYANMTFVHQSDLEFVIDFASDFPGMSPTIVSRIVLSPATAKKLWGVLGFSIGEFENRNGEIAVESHSAVDDGNDAVKMSESTIKASEHQPQRCA